jgi:hypothetical protein
MVNDLTNGWKHPKNGCIRSLLAFRYKEGYDQYTDEQLRITK